MDGLSVDACIYIFDFLLGLTGGCQSFVKKKAIVYVGLIKMRICFD